MTETPKPLNTLQDQQHDCVYVNHQTLACCLANLHPEDLPSPRQPETHPTSDQLFTPAISTAPVLKQKEMSETPAKRWSLAPRDHLLAGVVQTTHRWLDLGVITVTSVGLRAAWWCFALILVHCGLYCIARKDSGSFVVCLLITVTLSSRHHTFSPHPNPIIDLLDFKSFKN